MTEPWPLGGTLCPAGHLHFEPSHGLVETLAIETGAPAHPGEPATLVLTPFSPFRETTLLLRYDTEDMIRLLDGPLDCTMRHLPATGNILGKLRLAAHHDDGWIFPRDVLEALEAVDDVPLPARCGFWAVPGGVVVEVAVERDTPHIRHTIERSLEKHGVPVRELRLVEEASKLRRPLPLRCDLRELSFGRQDNAALFGQTAARKEDLTNVRRASMQ
jgi:phenylacetate-CoA ligase